MKSSFTKFVFTCVTVLSGVVCFAGTTDCKSFDPALAPLGAQIQAAVTAQATIDKIPAITYSVFSDSCLLFSGQTGAVDAEKSIYRIASISKVFTAIAMSQLIEKKLSMLMLVL